VCSHPLFKGVSDSCRVSRILQPLYQPPAQPQPFIHLSEHQCPGFRRQPFFSASSRIEPLNFSVKSLMISPMMRLLAKEGWLSEQLPSTLGGSGASFYFLSLSFFF